MRKRLSASVAAFAALGCAWAAPVRAQTVLDETDLYIAEAAPPILVPDGPRSYVATYAPYYGYGPYPYGPFAYGVPPGVQLRVWQRLPLLAGLSPPRRLPVVKP